MSPSEEVLHRPPLEEKLGYFLYQQSLEDSETLTQFNTFLLDHPNQPAGITTDSSTLFDAACASLVQHYGLEKDALKEHPLVKDECSAIYKLNPALQEFNDILTSPIAQVTLPLDKGVSLKNVLAIILDPNGEPIPDPYGRISRALSPFSQFTLHNPTLRVQTAIMLPLVLTISHPFQIFTDIKVSTLLSLFTQVYMGLIVSSQAPPLPLPLFNRNKFLTLGMDVDLYKSLFVASVIGSSDKMSKVKKLSVR